MPRFVLIEHSLRRVGGHFFQYAEDILGAAELAGFEPVLATHRSFQETSLLPSHWSVHPLFPYDWERIHRVPKPFDLSHIRSVINESRSPSSAYHRIAAGVSDRIKPTFTRLRWRRHASRVNGFAHACAELFERVGFEEGDQVFCATMGDADLSGLTKFLRTHQQSRRVCWHLQFHLNVYPGCESHHSRHDRSTIGLRRRFEESLSDVPRHRLYFYTTTDELTRQFNRLEVADFNTLPWPVGARFHSPTSAPNDLAPLRVVCAGDVRREKGAGKLARLVEELWENFLASGKLKLLFQLDQKPRSRAVLGLRRHVATSDSADPSQLPDSPLVAIKHPLDPDEYANLIKNAQIGLLMYDASEYYARCSGILTELLSAGVPVITPANCWLSKQFASAKHVGLTAHNTEQVCSALHEITENYRQHHKAAREFSAIWNGQHAPSRTIEILMRSSRHAPARLRRYQGVIGENRVA